MVKLQAATVSNKVVHNRKRKRQPDADEDSAAPEQAEPTEQASGSTTTVPTKQHDGGKKPRRTPQKNADRPSLQRRSSSNVVETSIPWP
ncbi:hypothetical protein KC352_g16947, partial [Hortaea werneckii]